MRNLFKDAWNRCDECGRFIAYDDFLTNKATVRQIAPSSEWTVETDEILCRDHAKKSDVAGFLCPDPWA